MLKFNNTHIFTGHIKQLLSSFNLPKYRVYTKKQEAYFLANHKEDRTVIETTIKTVPEVTANTNMAGGDAVAIENHTYYANYIKNNFIQRYINGKWHNTKLHYHYNKKIYNHTKNLVVKNNVYDSYTHEYLGDYLRFVRDYNDLDLMPLYNCFSNRICTNMNQKLILEINNTDTDTPELYTTTFNSADGNYKIYMLPVKLFQNYTIAIDCPTTIEMFCGIYHKYLDTRDKVSSLWALTYEKVNNTRFNAPFIYDKLSQITDIVTPELAQQEQNLKLFIKIPFNTDSSITILEGEYLNYNNHKATVEGGTNTSASQLVIEQNRTITNLEYVNMPEGTVLPDGNIIDYEHLIFAPISELQLLKVNTGESYPFADRLFEYLTDNVITNIDDIGDNVVRLQKVFNKNKIHTETAGLWENKYRILLYNTLMNEGLSNGITLYSDDKMDCLGYVDKDVEQYYTYPQTYTINKVNTNGETVKETKKYYVSVGKVNIYEDIYKAQAEQIRKQREGKK